VNVKYVLPNLSTFNQRGGLVSRSKIVEEIEKSTDNVKFQLVEIPADFVKNYSETEKTGLSLGSMLTSKTVCKIYQKENGFSKAYCLHTEPGIPRRTPKNFKTSKLCWFDEVWIDAFLHHLVAIIDFLGKPPEVIEVHPGTKQKGLNSIKSLILGLELLMIHLKDSLNILPDIFIENRTPHIISSGANIRLFRDELMSIDLLKKHSIGIILDVQQLFSKARGRFVDELWKIPHEILRGFHIHQLHRTPTNEGKINWIAVRDFIHSGNFKSDLHILPEVHHMDQLLETYKFCTDFLGF
jgi:hypothetical protein